MNKPMTFASYRPGENEPAVILTEAQVAKTFLTNEDYDEIDERLDELEENGGGGGGGGGVAFETDETLILENGILSVNTTNDMEQDNTRPITSAGVFAAVGNIEILLKTI